MDSEAKTTPSAGFSAADSRTVRWVIPAYNEEASIEDLIDRIAEVSEAQGWRWTLLVVDDGSRDATGELARAKAATLPVTVVRNEPNAGLGRTIRRGLREASESAGPDDVLLTLDADLTQDPGYAPSMLAKLDEGFDVVIASRYREGSAVEGLSAFRTMLSYGASGIVATFRPVRGVRDYSCGFRAYRVQAIRDGFERYGDEFVHESGFACMLEIAERLRGHATFAEVPFVLHYDAKRKESAIKILPTIGAYFRVMARVTLSAWRREPLAPLRSIALVLAIAAAAGLLLGWGGAAGAVLAALAAGTLAAATAGVNRRAWVIGGAAGFLGGGYAVWRYRVPAAIKALNSWYGGYPRGAVHGDFIAPILKASAVNARWSARGWLVALLVAVGAAVVGKLATVAVERGPASAWPRARTVAGFLATCVVAVALVISAYGAPFRAQSTHAQAPGTYRFDAAIYQNTYFNLLKGEPYYPGFVQAAAGDSRLIAEKDVRDGKFYGWAFSAAFIRMPWTFYIWRVLAPTGALFYVSLLCCVLALFATYWSLVPSLSTRAALIPPILFPLLLLHTGWLNLYFPEWWAALATLFSVLFLVRKRLVLAVVFAFLAGIFRDVALIWLAILVVWSLWRLLARRDREWLAPAITAAGLFGLFFALYTWHKHVGAAFIAAQPTAPGIGHMLLASAKRSIGERFFQPASYLMIPYGSLVGKHAVLLVAQLPGWWLVLRKNAEARLPVFALALFWIVFTATIGATSPYWGQLYTPVAVVGSAGLLAWAASGAETV